MPCPSALSAWRAAWPRPGPTTPQRTVASKQIAAAFSVAARTTAARIGSADRFGCCGTPLVIQKSMKRTSFERGRPERSAMAALRQRRRRLVPGRAGEHLDHPGATVPEVTEGGQQEPVGVGRLVDPQAEPLRLDQAQLPRRDPSLPGSGAVAGTTSVAAPGHAASATRATRTAGTPAGTHSPKKRHPADEPTSKATCGRPETTPRQPRRRSTPCSPCHSASAPAGSTSGPGETTTT